MAPAMSPKKSSSTKRSPAKPISTRRSPVKPTSARRAPVKPSSGRQPSSKPVSATRSRKSTSADLQFFESASEQRAVKYMAGLLDRSPKDGWPSEEEFSALNSAHGPPEAAEGMRAYANDVMLRGSPVDMDEDTDILGSTMPDFSGNATTDSSRLSYDEFNISAPPSGVSAGAPYSMFDYPHDGDCQPTW
ncbi:hypothetical protein HDZ31DRAFT_64622 [Schizophyllum fasciatum]